MWKRKGILVLLFCVMLCVSAFALEAPEMDATGSITLNLKTKDGPVPGGEITVYSVADFWYQDEAYGFKYNEEFQDCPYSLRGDLMSQGLANSILKYAAENNIEGTEHKVNSQGQVVISNLNAGLYLVCQTEKQALTGYSSMNAFLISVPMVEYDEWVYDVVADPKCSVATETTPTPSPTPTPPPGGEIPDTGQNNWPVPVLAVAGLLIFALGWAIRFRGKETEY